MKLLLTFWTSLFEKKKLRRWMWIIGFLFALALPISARAKRTSEQYIEEDEKVAKGNVSEKPIALKSGNKSVQKLLEGLPKQI